MSATVRFYLADLHYSALRTLARCWGVDQLVHLFHLRSSFSIDQTYRPMLLFFCDVDALKGINDAHGHAQGDLALQEASAILRSRNLYFCNGIAFRCRLPERIGMIRSSSRPGRDHPKDEIALKTNSKE
jgi:hypothetical protein